MKNNTTLYIVLGAIAAAVIYMLYKRGVFGGVNDVGATSPVLPEDAGVARQMKSVFKAAYGKDMPFWLLEIADEFYTGSRSMSGDYLVSGQVTKSGAILAAFASSWYGYGYEGRTKEQEDAANRQMYGVFEGWKASELSKRLS